MNNRFFIEVDCARQNKYGQGAPGDVFLSQRDLDEGRIVCVLADGLGSGVKANVLATLTATMALKYVRSDMDICKAAGVIMSTLPVCSQRKIGYSTFTIADIHPDGRIRMMEYDNPPAVLLEGPTVLPLEKKTMEIETAHLGRRPLFYSDFRAGQETRLVLFSDGLSQAGMGRPQTPLGWTAERAVLFLSEQIRRLPNISARQLCRAAVTEALRQDHFQAQDDISCAVIYFRQPRKLLVVTGPPIDRKKDAQLAARVAEFDGRKVICGGTTANLIARELGRTVQVDLSLLDPEIPPVSTLEGVDLVTEGTLTMSRTAQLLEQNQEPDTSRPNAAVRLMNILLESDRIEFVVGTKINEAHQDPNLPVELDIRRNLIRRIVWLLNEKYMKQASIELI